MGKWETLCSNYEDKDVFFSIIRYGLRRVFAEQPDMELEYDVEGEQFIARFPRKVEV